MARLESFRMKVTTDEKRMIQVLAERLQRNQSDAVRLVIREALRALTADNAKTGEAGQAQEARLCPN
jgi:hypothetical protein